MRAVEREEPTVDFPDPEVPITINRVGAFEVDIVGKGENLKLLVTGVLPSEVDDRKEADPKGERLDG